MANHPDFFQEHRLAKRENLYGKGINPYPYSFSTTHTINELHENFESLEESQTVITCYGRLLSSRKMGKSRFLDIIDRGRKFQLYVRAGESSEETVALLVNLDIGDWIGVTGRLFRTKTGEPTIMVSDIELLGKAVADVPFGKIHDGTTSYTLANIEVRRQKRYLDWITDPESVKRIETRSRIISLIRRFMEDKGFLEVDTPSLELVYGGADARPFKTNVWALGGQEVYLNVSLELPLKRYIIGGFPRVFAIAKCFRNEGIDATHNPEFTLMEWYEAFTDYEEQMTRFEELTCHVVENITGGLRITYNGREIDLTPPWKRIRIPDIVGELFGCEMDAIDRAALEERIDSVMSDEKLSFIGIAREQYLKTLAAEPLGALVMEVVERELEQSDRLWDPCFLCDHPRDISPLTKVKRGNPSFVERFEPHIAGFEIGNAFSELTDPIEQYDRFLTQRSLEDDGKKKKIGKDYVAYPMDMDFIHAIACGMPPTGGVGYGIDRLVMILTDTESIRDVIPFPMSMGSGG